jgi:hypothetical protein
MGKDAIYPFNELEEYGRALLGAEVYEPGYPRFHTLDRLVLLPPAFTPNRLAKMGELLREPLYTDVETESVVGGFKVRLPLVIGSMGSTDVARKNWEGLAIGAAISGIMIIVGENVCGMDEEFFQQDLIQGCSYQQYRICSPDVGFLNLNMVDDEILSQHRQIRKETHPEQILETTLEKFFIRQHRNGTRPCILIVLGQLPGIEVRRQQAL